MKNSPQLCRAGTGRRPGFQWYHWGYKWWRCGPNLPASPGLSVWSSGTPPTPGSVTAYTHISQGIKHLCSLLVFQPFYYIKCAFLCTSALFVPLPCWPVCLLLKQTWGISHVPSISTKYQYSYEWAAYKLWGLIYKYFIKFKSFRMQTMKLHLLVVIIHGKWLKWLIDLAY